MPSNGNAASRNRDRLIEAWDALRAAFGFPSGLAMIAGIGLGIGLPLLDDWLQTSLPVLTFDSEESGRSLLETIATTTVAVAGIAFSITVVAFTLASQQLSPRVLRSFRGDRMSQATLAVFLGTFTYCLVLLVRLGTTGIGNEPPNLAITGAVLAAITSFLMFAAFIAHIVSMLQPSSVIAAIKSDALTAMAQIYAAACRPEDRERAEADAMATTTSDPEHAVEADGQGYLTLIEIERVVGAAARDDFIVQQSARIGEYVLPGQELALVWRRSNAGTLDGEAIDQLVRGSFRLGYERTLVQDSAFPIRQLADIALKGLSPGVNDPTTAENALDAAAGILVEHMRAEHTSPVRVDNDEIPRFIALPPDPDRLIELAFDQVRVAASPHIAVTRRVLDLLDHLEQIARAKGVKADAIIRQRRLIAGGAGTQLPTEEEAREVRLRAGASG